MEIDAQDAFEINFFENLLKKDSKNPETLELLGGLYSKYEMANQALRIDRTMGDAALQTSGPEQIKAADGDSGSETSARDGAHQEGGEEVESSY